MNKNIPLSYVHIHLMTATSRVPLASLTLFSFVALVNFTGALSFRASHQRLCGDGFMRIANLDIEDAVNYSELIKTQRVHRNAKFISHTSNLITFAELEFLTVQLDMSFSEVLSREETVKETEGTDLN
jgi:hypothetical protein